MLIPLAHSGLFSNSHLPKILVLSLAALVILAGTVRQLLRQQPIALRLATGDLAWAILLTLLVLSAGRAGDWTAAADVVCYVGLLFILHLAAARTSSSDLERLLTGLWLVGIAAAAYGSVQSFYLRPLHTYPTYVATFGNINFAGGYVALIWPWLLVVLSREEPRHWRWWLALAGSVILVFYLIRTGSRGAWLGWLAGLGVYVACAAVFWRQALPWRRILVFLAVSSCGLGAALLHPHWREIAKERVTSLANWDRGSSQVRLLIWHGTTQLIREAPFGGVGAGQFPHHFYRYRHPEEYLTSAGRVVDDPHNLFLLLAAESGIIAALCCAWLLLSTAISLVRRFKQCHETAAMRVIATFLAMLITMAAMSLFASPLLWPATGILLPLITGWVGTLACTQAEAKPLAHRYRWLLAAGIGIIALSLLAWTITRTVSDLLLMAGQQRLAARDFATAARQLDWAGAWYPHPMQQVEQGRALLALHQYRAAATVFRQVVAIAPHLETAQVDLGLALALSGQASQALQVWRDAIGRFPASATIHRNLAKLRLDRREIVAARHHLLWVAILQPSQSDELSYLLDLGLCHDLAGDDKAALLCYQAAKDRYPQSPLPRLQLARLFQRLTLTDQALYQLQQASELGTPTEQSLAYREMGKIYETQQQYRPAAVCYATALRKNLDAPAWSYLHLAQLALIVGQEAAARRYLEQAIASGFTGWQSLEREPHFTPLTRSDLYRSVKPAGNR